MPIIQNALPILTVYILCWKLIRNNINTREFAFNWWKYKRIKSACVCQIQFNKVQHNTNYFYIIKYHAHLYCIYIVREYVFCAIFIEFYTAVLFLSTKYNSGVIVPQLKDLHSDLEIYFFWDLLRIRFINVTNARWAFMCIKSRCMPTWYIIRCVILAKIIQKRVKIDLFYFYFFFIFCYVII